jgi:uncharacterized protein
MNNIGESESFLGSLPSNPVLDNIKRKNTSKRIGFQFPFAPSSRGFFPPMTDTDVIKSNLIQLIKTEPGERVMLPDFGCPLKSLLFAPFDRELVNEMRERVRNSVRTYLPTVKILKLDVTQVDEYRSNGLPTLKIFMVCKISDPLDSIFDVRVSI